MTFPKSIKHSQAIKLILQQIEGTAVTTEQVMLKRASGRTLAEALIAPVDVPAFNCSRMDGYAINLDHLHTTNQTANYVVPLGKAIHAGIQDQAQLCADQAVPIMTGGVLPSDANAIVLKERATCANHELHFNELPLKGQFIRAVGSDLNEGQVVINSGQCLTAGHLGLLSSLGITEAVVFNKPKVALMMSGDELVKPGGHCLPGQVYEASSTMLAALLEEMGAKVDILETLSDNETAVTQCMQELQQQNHDVIITVGGVSMGDKDWIPAVLNQQGEVLFHKVQVKPGFPMLFGRLKKALFFGLPGNPVSAYTTLCQYVHPLIQKLRNQSSHPMIWRASICHELNKTHARREFLRGSYALDAESRIQVTVCGSQQSSRIASLAQANCFIILDESQCELRPGDGVNIQPFSQFKV